MRWRLGTAAGGGGGGERGGADAPEGILRIATFFYK
jgi:hypothetical protein